MTGTAAARRPPAAKLYSLIALMVFLWALNFIIGKIALREFPALLAGAMRASLAALIILPVYWWTGRGREQRRWRREDLPRLLFLGVVGVAMNQLFFLVGLGRTSASHAAILMAVTPLLVLLMGAAAGHERITARKLAGMGVAMAGVATLEAGSGGGREATVLGDLFILLASLTFAAFTVSGKGATSRHGSLTVNTFAYAGGAIVFSPILWMEGSRFSFGAVSMSAWAALLYMALFPSLVCYLIFYYALHWLPASRISAFSYLQPPLATGLAVLLLGEAVSGPLLGGGVLVLAGVVVAEKS